MTSKNVGPDLNTLVPYISLHDPKYKSLKTILLPAYKAFKMAIAF